MTIPSDNPKHVPNNDQTTLRKIYDENNFDDLLAHWTRIEICPKRRRKPEDTFHAEATEYEEGIKFIDPTTLDSMAVIFWYTDSTGRRWETIRMLRVGATIYDAEVRQKLQ